VSARRRLLEQSWADDGVYTDAGSTIEGRDALIAAIAEFHEQRPGVTIEVRSAIDAFGPHFRFIWTTVDGSGAVQREGIDVGRLAPDGRIASIIGFVGIAPPSLASG
jgi:hypothetical protein